jgi:hypothetical protein
MDFTTGCSALCAAGECLAFVVHRFNPGSRAVIRNHGAARSDNPLEFKLDIEPP